MKEPKEVVIKRTKETERLFDMHNDFVLAARSANIQMNKAESLKKRFWSEIEFHLGDFTSKMSCDPEDSTEKELKIKIYSDRDIDGIVSELKRFLGG